jgi:uncharacterized membrane protein YeiH
MNDRVDAIGATIFAVGAGSVAALIFGSVPFSVLDQHAFAYAVMSLTMGVIATAAFFALLEFVIVPVVDRVYWARRAARQERERMERIYRSWSVTRDQR